MTGEREERLAHQPLDDDDWRILDALAEIHRASDPVPAGLTDRVRFAMSLAALEAELAELTTLPLTAAGMRGKGYELAQTVTFSGEHLTAMISIESTSDTERRISGWVDTAKVRIELRTPSGTQSTAADSEGRFTFERVHTGLVHLVLWRTDVHDERPLMSPPIEI